MSAFHDQPCPRRAAGLTHTMNGQDGSRCVECGTRVYVRATVMAVTTDAPRRTPTFLRPTRERVAQMIAEEFDLVPHG